MRPAFGCGLCAACCWASAPDRSKHRTDTNRFILVPLQLTNVICSWAPTFFAYFISWVESPCSGTRIRGGRILRTRFYKPVFRLRAGFTIQRLVPDEDVHFRPPVTLLCMQPHLVFIATGWNVPPQPSLSL